MDEANNDNSLQDVARHPGGQRNIPVLSKPIIPQSTPSGTPTINAWSGTCHQCGHTWPITLGANMCSQCSAGPLCRLVDGSYAIDLVEGYLPTNTQPPTTPAAEEPNQHYDSLEHMREEQGWQRDDVTGEWLDPDDVRAWRAD